MTYDAQGRRESIDYGNNTQTTYTYDDLSKRLTRLKTVDKSATTTPFQDLNYTYDAVGNITRVKDDAHDEHYFDNASISATQTFKYDALYRLIEATGREKSGMLAPSWQGLSPDAVPHTTEAMQQYKRTYEYDKVGNITEMDSVLGAGWTRSYTYTSGTNRLASTTIGAVTYSNSYNDRGAITAMDHLDGLERQFDNQLRRVDINGSDDAVYHYGADGQRVLKVVREGQYDKTTVYIDGWELYEKYNTSTSTVDTAYESLHVMDDQSRVCLIETVTTPTPSSTVFRYQYGNHLGTAVLELDEDAEIISYEEFHPYGSSAWEAADTNITARKKRYRYTGKEKDEETGLHYHGARYYACWLGRWERPDPAGMIDGPNRYGYVGGKPVSGRDQTGMAEVPGPFREGAEAGALWYMSGLPDDAQVLLNDSNPVAGAAFGIAKAASGVDIATKQIHTEAGQKFDNARGKSTLAAVAGATLAVVAIFAIESLADPSPAGETHAVSRLGKEGASAAQDLLRKGLAAAYDGPGEFIRTVFPRKKPAGPSFDPPGSLDDMDPIYDFLESAGVEFDVDVLIKVVPDHLMPNARATWAHFSYPSNKPETLVKWSEHAPNDTVTIRMRESVFRNAEDLLATMAHEMHEINAIKKRVDSPGGLTVAEAIYETAAAKSQMEFKKMKDNLHHQAVAFEDFILKAYQKAHPSD